MVSMTRPISSSVMTNGGHRASKLPMGRTITPRSSMSARTEAASRSSTAPRTAPTPRCEAISPSPARASSPSASAWPTWRARSTRLSSSMISRLRMAAAAAVGWPE